MKNSYEYNSFLKKQLFSYTHVAASIIFFFKSYITATILQPPPFPVCTLTSQLRLLRSCPPTAAAVRITIDFVLSPGCQLYGEMSDLHWPNWPKRREQCSILALHLGEKNKAGTSFVQLLSLTIYLLSPFVFSMSHRSYRKYLVLIFKIQNILFHHKELSID